MDLQQAIAKVVNQFTKLNPTVIDCVNKKAKTMDVFKEEVYEYMSKYIPEEFHDRCYDELCAAAWHVSHPCDYHFGYQRNRYGRCGNSCSCIL